MINYLILLKKKILVDQDLKIKNSKKKQQIKKNINNTKIFQENPTLKNKKNYIKNLESMINAFIDYEYRNFKKKQLFTMWRQLLLNKDRVFEYQDYIF